jgi:hypothetical protein
LTSEIPFSRLRGRVVDVWLDLVWPSVLLQDHFPIKQL